MANHDNHRTLGDWTLEEMFHLDEEEIALLAAGQAVDEVCAEHAARCRACRARVDHAAGLLRIEPMTMAARPDRKEALLSRLVAAGAIAAPRREAFIEVALDGDAFCVVNTNTEVRIRPRVAVRRADADADPSGVAFFRRLGALECEIHLIRLDGGKFHLVVGIGGPAPEAEYRVALHRGPRELAREPAPHSTATFKSLRPGRYRVEVLDGTRTVGVVDVGVERR